MSRRIGAHNDFDSGQRGLAVLATALALLFVGIFLAACGSSAKTATSTTAAASTDANATTAAGTDAHATTSTSPGTHAPSAAAPGSPAAGATSRAQVSLSAYAACLNRHGLKVPARTKHGPLGLFRGVKLDSPTARSALKSCRALLRAALHLSRRSAVTRSSAPTQKAPAPSGKPARKPVQIPAALAGVFDRFTSCMRASGVPDFPEPEGAAFNVSHLDTSTPQYKAAESKCNSILQAVDPGGGG